MTRTAVRTERSPLDLPASEVMERRIVSVSQTAPLSEVERLLTESRISGMPVVDEGGRAVGVISYRDLFDHYADDPDARPRRSRRFYRLPVQHMDDEDFEDVAAPAEAEDIARDVMSPEVIHVREDATLAAVARVMVERSIHRVLVTDRAGRVVGIVGALGVLAAIAHAERR